jgi:hypothetical protein
LGVAIAARAGGGTRARSLRFRSTSLAAAICLFGCTVSAAGDRDAPYFEDGETGSFVLDDAKPKPRAPALRKKRTRNGAPPPLKIVPNFVSGETVTTLESLVDRARRGEVVGIAYAALERERRYVVNVAGEAARDPTYASGMVNALGELIADDLGIR